MSSRRLEFAVLEDAFNDGVLKEAELAVCLADPSSWKPLLEADYEGLEETDAPPGWKLQFLVVWLSGPDVDAQCFEYKLSQNDTWLYT